MKKIFLILLTALLLGQWSYGQVLYNTPSCLGAGRRAIPQAMLELVATNQGLLLPRVKDTSAITAGGKAGLMIYATSDNKLYMHNGSQWISVCVCNNVGAGSGGAVTPGTGTGTGVGTNNPDPKAVLDITATDRGLLLARAQDTSAITSGGVAGLLIYSLSDSRYYLHNGVSWLQLGNCTVGVTSGPSTGGASTGTVIDPSAMVEVRSTNRGLVLPRVVDTNAITGGGIAGLLIYSTSDNKLYLHNGKGWMDLCLNVPGTPGTITGFTGCPLTAGATLTQGVAGTLSISLNYTGGNGGTYALMDVASQGVGGLTAHLNAGTLQNGNSVLVFTVSGTPTGTGTASFPITFAGKTCTLQVTVKAATPTVSSFSNCPGYTSNSFTQGVSGSELILLYYAGGNGIAYPAMSVASQGVGGLTAKLAAGTLKTGDDGLMFTVTGTPTGSGTASFPITFGGKSCTLQITVKAATPTVSSFSNCPGTVSGSFTQGVSGSGSISLYYAGGNGIAYPAASVASQGVGGLTAKLAAGTLQTGSGTLTFTVTGTPTGSGTASFPITVGGQSCTLQVSVASSNPAAEDCPFRVTGTIVGYKNNYSYYPEVRSGSLLTLHCFNLTDQITWYGWHTNEFGTPYTKAIKTCAGCNTYTPTSADVGWFIFCYKVVSGTKVNANSFYVPY